MLEARDRIADGRAFRSYLLGIAHRVLLEHLREIDLSVDSVAALVTGPSTIAARRLEQRLLLEALRRLPIAQQVVLELYYWERIKANELAEIMGVSHSGMRNRIQRARDRLRSILTELSEHPELVASTIADLDDWAAQIRVEILRGEQ